MKLSDLLNEEVQDSTPANSDSNKESENIDTSKDGVEKIASVLEALSEEDTLIDELAKLAVISDLLDPEKSEVK
jgi:hypothetical protein